MRKFVAIEVGPRSSMELDVEGRWLVLSRLGDLNSSLYQWQTQKT